MKCFIDKRPRDLCPLLAQHKVTYVVGKDTTVSIVVCSLFELQEVSTFHHTVYQTLFSGFCFIVLSSLLFMFNSLTPSFFFWPV